MPRNKMDNKFKEQKHTLEQGAVILLMLWVYFASVIIISGAELNCVVEELFDKTK